MPVSDYHLSNTLLSLMDGFVVTTWLPVVVRINSITHQSIGWRTGFIQNTYKMRLTKKVRHGFLNRSLFSCKDIYASSGNFTCIPSRRGTWIRSNYTFFILEIWGSDLISGWTKGIIVHQAFRVNTSFL